MIYPVFWWLAKLELQIRSSDFLVAFSKYLIIQSDEMNHFWWFRWHILKWFRCLIGILVCAIICSLLQNHVLKKAAVDILTETDNKWDCTFFLISLRSLTGWVIQKCVCLVMLWISVVHPFQSQSFSEKSLVCLHWPSLHKSVQLDWRVLSLFLS